VHSLWRETVDWHGIRDGFEAGIVRVKMIAAIVRGEKPRRDKSDHLTGRPADMAPFTPPHPWAVTAFIIVGGALFAYGFASYKKSEGPSNFIGGSGKGHKITAGRDV
jgi:hypothetical protein